MSMTNEEAKTHKNELKERLNNLIFDQLKFLYNQNLHTDNSEYDRFKNLSRITKVSENIVSMYGSEEVRLTIIGIDNKGKLISITINDSISSLFSSY